MAALKDFKIDSVGKTVSETDGDVLTGTVPENKAVFDRFPKEIQSKHDGLVDYLSSKGIDKDGEFSIITVEGDCLCID